MSDRQFSIPALRGFGKKHIFLDCFGVEDYFIDVRGKIIRFEWSDRFGPLPVTKTGVEMRSIGPQHAFWRAASLWNLQGRRLNGNKAVWHEPKKPVLRHLGGKNYLIIEPGEPGYDW